MRVTPVRCRSLFITLTVISALAGCGPKMPPTTPPPAPPGPAPPTGVSSYKFIVDAANPANNLPEDVKFRRPQPLDQRTLPIYPADALAAHDGPHRELVRIVIDDHGSVSQVGDSPLGASDGGLYAAAFREAVDTAVRRWRFAPGALYKTEPGHDLDNDGKPDYQVATSIDVVPVYYDIRFTFEIVDGKGVVTKE
jgi:predicted small lipoprotein YifL